MIAKLTGLVDTLGETYLILNVNGVGYLVTCSGRTLGALSQKEEAVTLFIETLMRAESLQLYGFKTQEEQSCFGLLTTVQGVGARMALSLLSTLSPHELYQAVAAGDKAMLTRAEGVGPKLASRILTELKDKIPTLISSPSSVAPSLPSSILAPGAEEAISALVNLGYRRLEAATAITKAFSQLGEASLSDLVRHGLALLGRTGT